MTFGNLNYCKATFIWRMHNHPHFQGACINFLSWAGQNKIKLLYKMSWNGKTVVYLGFYGDFLGARARTHANSVAGKGFLLGDAQTWKSPRACKAPGVSACVPESSVSATCVAHGVRLWYHNIFDLCIHACSGRLYRFPIRPLLITARIRTASPVHLSRELRTRVTWTSSSATICQ